jgi:triosephosphate isomerase
MRKIVIAGNWKMYKDVPEAKDLVTDLKNNVGDVTAVGMIVCPPATNLSTVHDIVKDTQIKTGAQNMYWEEEGAYTGEISAKMILSCGAKYVIIGHSERRQYFGETDETVNNKIKAALAAGLKPIFCIGETLEQRENGITKDVVQHQLTGGLEGITAEQMGTIIIAYEPVWAIGTGKTATPDQAQDVHAFIRSVLSDIYNQQVSEQTVIQYGGSVKPENAAELLKQTDIDGALVGGACLKADSFAQIIKTAESL